MVGGPSVAVNKFPDDVADATTATNIETWLATLGITTYYEVSIEHSKGFWYVFVIYA